LADSGPVGPSVFKAFTDRSGQPAHKTKVDETAYKPLLSEMPKMQIPVWIRKVSKAKFDLLFSETIILNRCADTQGVLRRNVWNQAWFQAWCVEIIGTKPDNFIRC
jgi:hypothetical protein